MNRLFVPGEPVIFLTHKDREQAWLKSIAAVCSEQLTHPWLRFTVSSFQRGGNFFDLDNLAKLALDCIGQAASTVWVQVSQGEEPGLEIAERIPPDPPASDAAVYITKPRRRSVNPVVPMPELASNSQLGQTTEPLGVFLAFDSADERISRFDFEGPIKPLIDGLGPILGPAPQGPADYRIRDLRITRGKDPTRSGVSVRFWHLPSK